MANLNLYAPIKESELTGTTFTFKEYECAVRYLWSRVISGDRSYPTFMFKYGTPGTYVGGKYGYEYIGSMGMHAQPKPMPLQHRIGMRYPPIPNYLQKYGNYFRFVVGATDYVTQRKFELEPKESERKLQNLLRSLNSTYDDYLRYLSWSILKGKQKTLNKYDPGLYAWVNKYIEPTNLSSEGSSFYLSEGYGEINLQAVIDKKKITTHPLKEALKKINDELVKDTKKVEYSLSEDDAKNKKIIKDNFIREDVKKFIGMCILIKNEILKIKDWNRFTDVKYKVKNDATSWEGIVPKINGSSDLILVLSGDSVRKWNDDKTFLTPGTYDLQITSDWFGGVEVITSMALDENTAYLITRDLIQCWFMPELAWHYSEPFFTDETEDYKIKFGHSLDLIDIHCNMYFTCK